MRAKDLTVGCAYFVVMFNDEALRVPIVQTLIYIGERTTSGHTSGYLFRELKSGDDDKFFIDKKDLESLILDEQGLITKLTKTFGGELATGGRNS